MEVAALVRAAAAGDQAAWDRLVERYVGLLWRVARRHRLGDQDARDVVQTTWLRLAEHLDRLERPEYVGAWLATTARNESLRVLRLARRQLPMPVDELPDDGVDGRLEAGLLLAERDRKLWAAFAALSERCRTLLELLVADPPPSYEEIGAALGMPVGSIGPTRARCLDRLRERVVLAGIGPEEAR